MIDPGEHTVADVKDWVRDEEPDGAVLDALARAEANGDDRVTLMRFLLDRREDADEPDPDAVTVDTDESADDSVRGQKARRNRGPTADDADTPPRDSDDYDPAAHPYWLPSEVPNSPDVDIPLVAVQPPHEGGFAGYWFENGNPRVVRRNRRVDRAIVDGPLEYITAAPNREDGEYL